MRRWRTDGALRRFARRGGARLRSRAAWRAPRRRQAGARSFSAEGLKRVGDYFKNEIVTGKIPGAIVLIQQHGKPVYFESFGFRDVATRTADDADTIFRLYSMSKAGHLGCRHDAGR